MPQTHPKRGELADALWQATREQSISVAAAARRFHVAPGQIVEAVNCHYWLVLDGPLDDFERLTIEHEGA